MAEDAAQEAAEHSFGADFVFRSPRKTKDDKEVTDVLVLFDDFALILEVKSMNPKEDGTWRDPDLRWVSKKLDKAARQVGGAHKHLDSGRPVTMENQRRGNVEFNTHKFPHLIGLIVLNHPPTAFVPSEVSSDFRDLGVPTHVISLNDLLNLATFLDTPHDLIHYIATRIEVDYPKFVAPVHEEQTAFEFYLQHFEQLHSLRAKHVYGDEIPEEEFLPAGDFLRDYVGNPDGHKPFGALFDSVIDALHDHDETINGPLLPDGTRLDTSESQYIEAATALARFPRVKRVSLGKVMHDTVIESAESGEDGSFVNWSRSADTVLVFLATSHSPDERDQRMEVLLMDTMLAKQWRQANRGIGVATEATIGDGRSHDVVVVESTPTPDPEAVRLAEDRWGGDTSLLSDEVL